MQSFPARPRIWTGHGLTITVTGHDTLQTAMRATGELDLASAPLLRACFENELASGRRYGRLDLVDIAFVDSTGLTAVVDAHHDFLAAHGMLVVTGVSPRVGRLIHVLGLDDDLLISQYQPPSAASVEDHSHLLQATG
jgi:anti-sigma B factor antagonist